jgi:hypothetical protein
MCSRPRSPTSFAATTPAHWRLKYWDENLLGAAAVLADAGVGGHHSASHVAGRAFELAEWYRARGAKVVLGIARVVVSEECAPHADALALGDGVQPWPRILRDIEAGQLQSRYVATYENDYSEDPRRAGRSFRGMGSSRPPA